MRELAGGKFELMTGLDADRQDDQRKRLDNNTGVSGDLVFDQDEKVQSTGAYLHGRYRVNDAWSLRAGVRYDHISFDVMDNFLSNGDDSGDIDFNEVSSSLALNYDFGSGVTFVSISTSFDTPTTTELANPDGSGGFNGSLDVQTAVNYEIGVKQSVDSFYYELALFHISLKDELVPFEVAAFPGRRFFANAGESSRDGFEAMLRWQGNSGLAAEFSYTFSDFRFENFVDADGNDFSGSRLPGLPRHFAYASLSVESEKGLFGRFDINYSGDLYAENANNVNVSSYVVGNIRFGFRAQAGRWRLEPYLGIYTLFDESYNNNIRINAFGACYFEPAPDRNYYAGIVMRFE